MKLYIVKQISESIKIPVAQWPGNCSAICSSILKAGFVEGKLRRGQYHGEISEDSVFGARPFTQHTWISQNIVGSKEIIFDPTAWCFLGSVLEVAPFVYVGMDDDRYDFGGNDLRGALSSSVVPEFNPEEEAFKVDDPIVKSFLEYGYGIKGELSLSQLFWLANRSLLELGDMAEDVYKFIESTGKTALIPVDNKREVLG